MDLSVIKTRLLLKSDLAFYASIMLQSDVHIDNAIETACTDGKYIKFNETWMNQHTPEQQLGVMVHEILHVAYLHMFRGEHLEQGRWNEACDYHINYYIVNKLGLQIPKGCYDPKYAGLSSEEIYDLLPKGTEPSNPDLVPSDQPVSEADVKQVVQQAAMEAQIQRQVGKVPADILRRIEEEKNPLLPWQVLLENYQQEKAQDDYSWQKRNLYYPDHYLPSLYSETIGIVSTYVDCSCSVQPEELEQYAAEIWQIMSELNPLETRIVSFDTRITHIQVIEQEDDQPIVLKGGGGTDPTEVAEMINDRDDAVNIIFTDGEYSPVYYNKPVLHIIINNKSYRNPDHEVIHAVI
jgi:predicted metal-dependent peptidase